jgi:putative nucleotidyltransferase with HDIG domain
MIFGGPAAGIACALAASTTIEELRSGKPIALHLYNGVQLSVSMGLAGLSYQLLGGEALSSTTGTSSSIAPALVAALVFYVMNVVLVVLAMSALTRRPFGRTLRDQGFLSYGVSLLVLAFLGLLIAHLIDQGSWAGLLLLVLPFMAARRTFRVYVELAEAYTGTVRSLVAAIEAKDPYTCGHSERVAVYARRLAEELRLPRSEVDLVERAALLHDVGKIGIDVDTLTSPAQLSAEEVRTVRQHPAIGSELISDVEFLSDIVAVVRHHHERVDGSGYPDGLAGESIPRLARVLAVTDAYDAMTSDRAYRLGMSPAQALDEVSRVSGSQLDAQFAHAFAAMLQRDGADPG